MSTFREDLHLGHKVPLVEPDDISNRGITNDKMADQSVDERVLEDGAVTTPKIHNGAVTEEKLGDESVTNNKLAPAVVTPDKIDKESVRNEHISKETIAIDRLNPEVQNMIFSAGAHGVAVANEFGDNNLISVSQKKLTDAFVKVWQKLEDMTGEMLQGISMQVTPEYFIGEDGCDIHVTANTVDTNGIFEQIKFFINGEVIESCEDIDFLEFDAHIDETSVIKCEAKIMGVWYERQAIISHYNSFWLGAGTAYTDIMNVEHVIPITNGMRGAYNVNFANNDHLFVIVGDTLRSGFLRADLNGFEIPFTESSVTIDGKVYKVFTSDNAYQTGIYNIDING